MRSDTLIREDGMRALSDKLGLVEAERFISLVMREKFDYTKWQADLYQNESLEELADKANNLWNKTHK